LPETGDWASFSSAQFGQVEIQQAGVQTVKLRPKAPSTWRPINVRSLTLTSVTE